MSDDGNNEAQATAPAMEEDVNTTPPNPPPKKAAGDGWQMPEPVFRSTSGYLPQGFEKKFPHYGTDDETPTAPAPQAPDIEVEPQPEIAETAESPSDISPNEPPTIKKGGAGRIILVLLGLFVAFGLVVAFIAVVYFLFLSPSVNGTIE